MKIKELIDKGLPYTQFENEYFEKFFIFDGGFTVYFGGDETDDEAHCLFNDKFNIWSQEEIEKLGEALVKLSKKKGGK